MSHVVGDGAEGHDEAVSFGWRELRWSQLVQVGQGGGGIRTPCTPAPAQCSKISPASPRTVLHDSTPRIRIHSPLMRLKSTNSNPPSAPTPPHTTIHPWLSPSTAPPPHLLSLSCGVNRWWRPKATMPALNRSTLFQLSMKWLYVCVGGLGTRCSTFCRLSSSEPMASSLGMMGMTGR